MTHKIWKLGSIAMIVPVGAALYYLGVSSSGPKTNERP
jgi:hypothetical protein